MPTDDASAHTVVVLDRKLARAVEYAVSLHHDQTRKGTAVPYAAHLLGVASLVLEGGGNQKEAIAALLHDALEDTAATPKQISKRFGRKVARIVIECTDVPVDVSTKRKRQRRGAENWLERKTRSLQHVRDPSTSVSVLRVKASDALYNARATLTDLRRFGPETWERFNAGAVDQLWYYRSLSVVLSARLPGLLSDELRVTVREMEQVAGWWFDVGDPQLGR
jgi:(p)ppGpp synthase/HD superfamily hydrolase